MTGDGHDSDNFWPGYVDAISNLVLNLLFVVAILTMAVFLFAIELGRKQGLQIGGVEPGKAAAVKTAEIKPDDEKKRLEAELKDMARQVASLKAEKAAAARAAAENEARAAAAEAPAALPDGTDPASPAAPPKNESGAAKTPPKRVEASEKQPVPETSLDKLHFDAAAVVVIFRPDAVTLTKPEQDTAREALAKVAASGRARIEVRIRGGFSETRRLAFYRAMAVRNLLIDMKLPLEKIDVSIQDVKSGGDGAKVLVYGAK